MSKRRTKPCQPRGPDWAPRLFAVLSEGVSMRQACKLARIGRQTVRDRRLKDPDFDRQVKDALEDAADLLEEEAVRRATRKAKPSDALLMFLLRGRRPDVFGSKVDHHHQGRVTLSVVELSDDDLQRIAGGEDEGQPG
jgi:hypothetical protein